MSVSLAEHLVCKQHISTFPIVAALTLHLPAVQETWVQSLGQEDLLEKEIPWPTAHQASLSFTSYQSLLKLMSIELVMPFNHLILSSPLLLPSFPASGSFPEGLVRPQ